MAADLPRVTVLGKAGCAKCEAAKKKLDDHFGLPYEFVDVADPGGNWRDTRAADALATAVAEADLDPARPPILYIDGKAHGYADAMKALKQWKDSTNVRR
jgi:glutaredoxin